MRTLAISILVLTGATFAAPAFAQDAPAPPASADPSYYVPVGVPDYSPPTNAVPSIWSDMSGPTADRFEAGLNALDGKNFARAELIFQRAVRQDRNNANANFYLGATRMELGKWEQARKPLEIAVKKNPKHPDPKSRLAVTYAKLGDRDAASALRADLVKMNEACEAECKLSPYILEGIQMIDEALATN